MKTWKIFSQRRNKKIYASQAESAYFQVTTVMDANMFSYHGYLYFTKDS